MYTFINSNSEYKTVGDYCTDLTSPAFKYSGREQEFLLVKNEKGVSNLQSLILFYNEDEKAENQTLEAKSKLIKVGVSFVIPDQEVELGVLFTNGIEVISTDYSYYKSSLLAKLESSSEYRTRIDNNIKGVYTEYYPDITVYIWIRSLSLTEDESRGRLLDVSKYISNISINSGKNGGNFSFSLPPISASFLKINEVYNWVIDGDSFTETPSDEFISFSPLHRGIVNNELKRQEFFFHNVLSANDLVFIKFESLEIDKTHEYSGGEIPFSAIAGGVYDMIGLIDSNTISTTADGQFVQIDIKGRDLSKLFIEDGTYFFSLENLNGQFRFASGGTFDETGLKGRLFDNSNYYLSLQRLPSIKYVLEFLIQILSTIEIVPSELFDSYGNRRNKTYKKQKGTQFKEVETKGIWSIIKLNIDPSVASRRIVDSSLSSANGPLLNFIKKICQEPFVEFMMDTYYDTFNIVVRKPPIDRKSIISYLSEGIRTENGGEKSTVFEVRDEVVINDSLHFDDQEVYSWYSFKPQNIVQTTQLVTAYLPAIFFEEYAKIWGSRPLELVHNYNSFNNKDAEKQAILDLFYIIESHAYLPFTRKGTITIVGDRRFRKGNFFRYIPTGEIYYIEGVQNNFSITKNGIERTTTLQVTRGMVESLIYGVKINGVNYSYFDIINLPSELKTTKNNKGTIILDSQSIYSQVFVNKKIFNFFIRREQFSFSGSKLKLDDRIN